MPTAPPAVAERRLPVGAEVQPGGAGTHFRVWAPEEATHDSAAGVQVILEGKSIFPLSPEDHGYWSGWVEEAEAGDRYRYRLSTGDFPDPASRFQPEGPHGPSQIVDSGIFRWSDQKWRGVRRRDLIIYELHIGTFSREGNWSAAARRLPHLVELGVTAIEVMPVADFPGRYGWGYDGVNLFAPTRLYGTPDEFRSFVNQAHQAGIGVILDVVYNHLGPDGNFLHEYSPHYFSSIYKSEWGDALNFDGPDCGPVRELFVHNAAYWIDEFHLDGLRLDAAQQIFDTSPRHVLAEIAERTRAVAGEREICLIAENEAQTASFVRPEEKGGHGLDAIWNEDFHHSAIVALTGRSEAYYTDYRGLPQEFVSSAKWGFLYQGQRYKWQDKRRGTPGLDLAPRNFINFLENHDQVANSLWGRRLPELTSWGRYRALTALLLLGPNLPMLFQGQEFAASAPFLYFADHNPELAKLVAKGRADFLKQFPSIATKEATVRLPNPEEESTFRRCKLDFSDRDRNPDVWRLYCDLLRLRKSDPILGKVERGHFDGAVLNRESFLLRFFGQAQDDRLLLINLGRHVHLDPAPEPLLAPPSDCAWQLAWSSEDPSYGGSGTPAVESDDNWHLPAEAAVLLTPKPI